MQENSIEKTKALIHKMCKVKNVKVPSGIKKVETPVEAFNMLLAVGREVVNKDRLLNSINYN
ncbi:hypothetical protein [Sphingobacterium sp. IITKGP-BTPF85]|uniref:hypothetical protein n=1 Tax=Sphingobacterium sp. IITKGP-BTPF85 TaxID=1338009 RepID=UPI000389E8E1|nr:hypothetical protein [Sphingobacterium sp. IITKGP-BTPF85]KKX49363.1 hypothetical protein L950_0215990 [Sphingobacterium sp. IITKGP-BTPF85]